MSSLLTTEFVSEDSPRALTRSRIRPLVEDDLVPIAHLYRRVGHPVEGFPSLLKRLFFDLPWRDEALSSLVCEDECGLIIGCLGIMPRPMKFRGRAIQAAVGHHFVVESSSQGLRGGIELVRRFIRGPQDLALGVGNEFSRRIWKFLGGSVSPLHSFSWTRALRPAQYALSFLRHRGLPASAAVTLNPACHAVDATLNLFGQRVFPLKAPDALADELDAVTLFACMSAFASDRALQPVYDMSSLQWLLATLNDTRHRGQVHKVTVRTHSGRPLGWYVYVLRPAGVGEVLQIGGKEESARDVLNHLFYHARQRGAVAVTGPMDARLLGALTESHCIFHGPHNSWTLIHSRDQRITESVHAGDAFMSRLETAWWGTT